MKKLMMTIALSVLAAPACATNSQTSAPNTADERFDPVTYCRKLSEAKGGDYRIEENCLIEESQAQRIMSMTQTPSDIEQKCRKIAKDAGGSYKVMEQCIQKELKGKAK